MLCKWPLLSTQHTVLLYSLKGSPPYRFLMSLDGVIAEWNEGRVNTRAAAVWQPWWLPSSKQACAIYNMDMLLDRRVTASQTWHSGKIHLIRPFGRVFKRNTWKVSISGIFHLLVLDHSWLYREWNLRPAVLHCTRRRWKNAPSVRPSLFSARLALFSCMQTHQTSFSVTAHNRFKSQEVCHLALAAAQEIGAERGLWWQTGSSQASLPALQPPPPEPEFLFGKVLTPAGWPQRNEIWAWAGFAISLFKAFMVRFNIDIQINYLKSSEEAHQIFLTLNRFISIRTYLCYLNSIACS